MGGVGLILGVKNKLRNAWAYFRGRGGGEGGEGAYMRGAYFKGLKGLFGVICIELH